MDPTPVSPMSLQRSPSNEKNVVVSPVEKAAYFPDEKIFVGVAEGMEVYTPPVVAAPLPPTEYSDKELPERAQQIPFWRRYFSWLLAGAVVLVIMITIIIGLVLSSKSSRGIGAAINDNNSTNDASDNIGANQALVAVPVTNATLHSVASSGLFLKDGTTWNMNVFSQQSDGNITLQISLDGDKFEAAHNVSFSISPKIGSPMSATAEQDQETEVVIINLFYLSGSHNITMASLNCASGSGNCTIVTNMLLPTDTPADEFTGLAAVNVNDSEDWRVYYHDNQGSISELQGKTSGFNKGVRIGGSGLNASSISAVNVNSTTNNIVLFYTDALSQDPFTMQFTAGAWTTRINIPLSLPFPSWNPVSGLGSAYCSYRDELHLFFTATDRSIFEYLGTHVSSTVNTTWGRLPTRQVKVWQKADYTGADIAAVGWGKEARFFQMSQGGLAMGRLSNLTWTEGFA